MLGFPLDLAIGESSIRGDFEVEGDLEAAIRIAEEQDRLGQRSREYLTLARLVSRLPRGLICQKLRLQPRERFLDIGCGWGSLVLYAAQNYGVDITLSEP